MKMSRSKRYYEKHKNDPEFKRKNKENHDRWVQNNRERLNAYQREYALRKVLERNKINGQNI